MTLNPTKPRGRPSKYARTVAAEICRRLSGGETLRAICRDSKMPPESTVRGWVLDDADGFSAQYAEARETGYLVMADEILAIADDGSHDSYKDEAGNTRTDTDVIARSRLRVDTRKWLLSKALPKIYGDKIEHQHGGADELLTALAAAGERARDGPRS